MSEVVGDTSAQAVLETRGWVRFPAHPATLAWVSVAEPEAQAALRDPQQATQWQCENTWFVGVDALRNDATGAVANVPLAGPGPDLAQNLFGPLNMHRAQLSAVTPGYPKPRAGESPGAFRYRQIRDAAHVDGLLPTGPDRRRVLGEPHAWILGVSLTEAAPDAASLVVWDASHRIMGQALSEVLRNEEVTRWSEVDLTEVYQAKRKRIFETCERVTVPLRPGEAVLLHRHLLHGIAPWPEDNSRKAAPRIIAYFRPQLTHDPALWLAP